jgi:hypothetical protein
MQFCYMLFICNRKSCWEMAGTGSVVSFWKHVLTRKSCQGPFYMMEMLSVLCCIMVMCVCIYKNLLARQRWLMPIILATQEAEIRRIVVQSQIGK